MSERNNPLGQPIGDPVDGWHERQRPPRAAMAGRYCRVEPFDLEAHAQALYDAYIQESDSRNWTYLYYGPFNTFEGYLGWVRETCLGDDPFFHTIIDLDTATAVGVASFMRINPPSGVIEVGHIRYSQALQRTRAATEAMYLMMARAFDELGYRRYEWKTDAMNEPSRQAALRLGFSFEGIFRQHVVYKGRNRDTAWYSIVDAEWPALKRAFETWLEPSNFDEAGVQRSSLSDLIGEVTTLSRTRPCSRRAGDSPP